MKTNENKKGFLNLHLKALGGGGLVFGTARALTCFSEVPFFQVAGALQRRWGTWRLLLLAQAAFVIRFLYYASLTSAWPVLWAEPLHGLTFALMWSTACIFSDSVAPTCIKSTLQVCLFVCLSVCFVRFVYSLYKGPPSNG